MPDIPASASKQSVIEYSNLDMQIKSKKLHRCGLVLIPLMASYINQRSADIRQGCPDALLIQCNLVATVADVWTCVFVFVCFGVNHVISV